MKAATIYRRLPLLTRFILLGSVLELLYLLIFTVIQRSTFQPKLSLSGVNWPWILTPSQLLVGETFNPGSTSTVSNFNYFLLCLIILALACFYLYTVVHAFHSSNNVPVTSRWLFVPVVGAIIFGITLLFLPSLFNNAANSFLVKSLALVSHIINCVLLWTFLSILAPERRLGGTILYAWNPLALLELAGNGHSEGFLISFLLLTTLLIIQQKGRWYDFWAMVFLGCAISINFIALLFAPILIWFSVRLATKQAARGQQSIDALWDLSSKTLAPKSRSNLALLILEFFGRAIVALVMVSMLFLPFWSSSSTFLNITSSFKLQHFLHSPLSILVIPVRWLYGLLVQGLHQPATVSSLYLQPVIAADMTVLASAMFIFALIYLYLLGKVGNIDTLLNSLCLSVLAFIVIICGQFWPWYILWVVWIIALRRFDSLTVSVLLLSCTTLLTYPLLFVDNLPIAMLQPLLIFGIPLIYFITQIKRSKERMTIHYDRRSETT